MAIARMYLGKVVGENGADGLNGEQGERGEQGKGFNPRGTWTANTYYTNTVNNIDFVEYEGSSYYCKVSHSRTITPDVDTDYWGVLALGGDKMVRKMYESFVDAEDWGDFTNAPHPTAYYSPFNFRAVKQMSDIIDSVSVKQLVVDPIYKERFGIALGETTGNTVEFYAKVKPDIGFNISFYADDVNVEEIFDTTYTKDTSVFYYDVPSNDLTISCNVTGTKYWGDGNSSSALSYTYLQDGYYTVKCTITDGIIGDLIYSVSPFGTSKLTKAIIGESVTRIGEYAFYDNNTLTSVSISNTVEVIDSHAFRSCSGLHRITIPYSVKELGENVFANSGVNVVVYEGTMAQFKAIKFTTSGTAINNSYYWYDYSSRPTNLTVSCIDGDITY